MRGVEKREDVRAGLPKVRLEITLYAINRTYSALKKRGGDKREMLYI